MIADRNRHVRDFLRRELLAEGYQVEAARDGREVLHLINGGDPPQLVILDLEIPYLDELEVLSRVGAHHPPIPVIIHTLLPEHPTRLAWPQAAAVLEKRGDTDLLKTVVAEVLGQRQPEQAAPAQ